MSIALSTAGFWHYATMDQTLETLARKGVRVVEFFPYPPHVDPRAFGRWERTKMRRRLKDLGIRCASSAFSVELNLLSLHTGLHDLAMDEFRRAMEIGADLDAPCFVLAVGRRHGILPAPREATIDFMCDEIRALAEHGRSVGIKVALETLPSDLLTTGKEVKEIVDRIDHPNLGICYDCSNTVAHEDPAEGVRAAADKLFLVHVSDCWRNRWGHFSIGRGEIDFTAFAGALRAMNYGGDVVYELMDGEDPEPRIDDGMKRLREAGFAA